MPSVLVVEDDQHIREAVARTLAGAGYAVRTEPTAARALTAVVDWRPDDEPDEYTRRWRDRLDFTGGVARKP